MFLLEKNEECWPSHAICPSLSRSTKRNERTNGFPLFQPKKRREKTITIIAGDNKTQLKTLINSAKLQ